MQAGADPSVGSSLTTPLCFVGTAGSWVWSKWCWSHMEEGDRALSDALCCVGLGPDWPKAHYRVGVVLDTAWKPLVIWQIKHNCGCMQNYVLAADAFSRALFLAPDNEEVQTAGRLWKSCWYGRVYVVS